MYVLFLLGLNASEIAYFKKAPVLLKISNLNVAL